MMIVQVNAHDISTVDFYVLQICDFGLAKWKNEAATQTTIGKRGGTYTYMPPEAFVEPPLPRERSYDVYSFGILLWELLSEKTPFEHGTSDISSLFVDVTNMFLPRCMEAQTRSSDENSVCLSVRPFRPSVRPSARLSVKLVLCDKMEERSVQISISYERSFSLLF